MVNSYYYNGNLYEKRTANDAEKGFIAASLASAAIMSTMPVYGKPFQNQLQKEHSQNHLYKNAFLDSLEISGLNKKGVTIAEMQNYAMDNSYSRGENAAFSPKNKVVKINTDKISIAGFHELGHAMNSITGKFGKFLSKIRTPGMAIAGWMGYLVLFSSDKPKEAKRNAFDFIKDNSGKIAFACLLPMVLEEGLASFKGVKLARKTGLSKTLIKNMEKLYKKAFLTYAGYAITTGLAVGAANMIMQKYTRPKKIEDSSNLFF